MLFFFYCCDNSCLLDTPLPCLIFIYTMLERGGIKFLPFSTTAIIIDSKLFMEVDNKLLYLFFHYFCVQTYIWHTWYSSISKKHAMKGVVVVQVIKVLLTQGTGNFM